MKLRGKSNIEIWASRLYCEDDYISCRFLEKEYSHCLLFSLELVGSDKDGNIKCRCAECREAFK